MLSFDELTEARRSLQDFCRLHVPSLLILNLGVSFLFEPNEPESEFADGAVHNMTTTATCIASLDQCPPRFWPSDMKTIDNLRTEFSTKALLRQDHKWKSEESAAIYCRCRALPAVISGIPSDSMGPAIENHIRKILHQLEAQPERFGIGEADPGLEDKEWYPPNAFHTYWTLEILNGMKSRFPADYERLSPPRVLDLTRRREGMVLWARQTLGYQIGLHSPTPQSSLLDSDQLAWSLAILLRFDNLKVDLENRDFIKQAFKCLFSTQVDGTWRHYKPLFHYKKVGNAYCYVFETFAALLQCALRSGIEGEMVRELLAPYCENLMNLWRHAYSTKIELSRYTDFIKRKTNPTRKEIGWCSGHRINFTDPETWATASAFSYAQSLRKLVGIWCRESAFNSFKTPASQLKPTDAADEIVRRGKTWGSSKAPVSEVLWTAFINPTKMHQCTDRLEPDSQPIAEKHARSAILFGPPGTSKTTLIRCLAGVIGWKYVELHASHFVAEGLTQVQKTADTIFKRLLELDHAVVLFDEIDELVRERDIEKDAFGRFLTTSMLPKLAELWDARKILYFVATNHISYFDSAIIRSHRFDALMLVSPPSHNAKIKDLTDLLDEVHGLTGLSFEVQEQEVQRKLDDVQQRFEKFKADSSSTVGDTEEMRIARWRDEQLDDDLILAKFALLRHDELDELAYRLASILRRGSPSSKTISEEILTEALRQVTDTEWRKRKSYLDYIRDIHSERRDFQMMNAWEVSGNVEASVQGIQEANGCKWLVKAVDSPKDINIPGFQLHFTPPGRIALSPVPPK